MASDEYVVSRMRAAQVPPQVWEKSLLSERFTEISEDFDKKKYLLSAGTVLSYTVQTAERKVSPARAALACLLIAKSLVLKQKEVYCASLPELVGATNDKAAYESKIGSEHCGVGYLIIPDAITDIEAFPRAAWLMAQAYMAAHVSRGGGLVVGVHDRVGCLDDSWSSAFTFDLQLVFAGAENRKVR